MKLEKIIPLLFVLSALGVMGASWWTRESLPVSRGMGNILGSGLFLLGITAFTWSVAYLGKAFLGDVTSVTDKLVTSGPYRWVRHPLYLSMILTLLGIATALRSTWGILSTPALFLPFVILRARLEERSLSKKHNHSWDEYARQTRFLFPFVW